MIRKYPLLMENFVLPIYDIVKRTSRFKFSRILQKTQWLSREEIERMQTTSPCVSIN